MKITVSINGDQLKLEDGIRMSDLLETQGYDIGRGIFAVAVNSEFLPRDQYAHYQVRRHDRVDIVQPIAGG